MARSAHFGAANVDICALALMEAVAPVKIRVGGCAVGEGGGGGGSGVFGGGGEGCLGEEEGSFAVVKG